MQELEYDVDDTVLFQQVLPCQRAQKEIHPHGKDEDQYDKALLVHPQIREDHGERIGEDKAEYRADEREQQRQPERFQILRRGYPGDIEKREPSVFAREPIVQDHEQRYDDKGSTPEHIRPCQQLLHFLMFILQW